MTDSELIVDLRGRLSETIDDFWDAVSEQNRFVVHGPARRNFRTSSSAPSSDEGSGKGECGLLSDGEPSVGMARPRRSIWTT
ncbi:hypothetical protein ABT382_37135 [Streptomyces pharetrae]|uniref:hypothetical protein n=1 Tax=Streptomyces pharetrae TaxID=291370 RepID=UPI00335AF925